MNRPLARIALAAAALSSVAFLAGCSSSSSDSAAAPSAGSSASPSSSPSISPETEAFGKAFSAEYKKFFESAGKKAVVVKGEALQDGAVVRTTMIVNNPDGTSKYVITGPDEAGKEQTAELRCPSTGDCVYSMDGKTWQVQQVDRAQVSSATQMLEAVNAFDPVTSTFEHTGDTYSFSGEIASPAPSASAGASAAPSQAPQVFEAVYTFAPSSMTLETKAGTAQTKAVASYEAPVTVSIPKVTAKK